MNISIVKAVGRKKSDNIDADNEPDDIKKIKKLLTLVKAAPKAGFKIQVPEKITDDLVKAIEDFQKIYGKVDGVVSPGKTTF